MEERREVRKGLEGRGCRDDRQSWMAAERTSEAVRMVRCEYGRV